MLYVTAYLGQTACHTTRLFVATQPQPDQCSGLFATRRVKNLGEGLLKGVLAAGGCENKTDLLADPRQQRQNPLNSVAR